MKPPKKLELLMKKTQNLSGNMREDVDLRDNDETSQKVRAAYEEDPES